MINKAIKIFVVILLSLTVLVPPVSATGTDDAKKAEIREKEACKKRQREREAQGNYKCPMFGDPDDDGKGANDTDCDGLPSTANFLQDVFTFIRYLGPALAIVLSVVEFVKAAAAQDADALARAGKKTGWRVALAILLFFLPVLINTVFSWFGWYGTCGIS